MTYSAPRFPADRPADVRLISSASAGRELFPAFRYVYVDDVQAAHARVARGTLADAIR